MNSVVRRRSVAVAGHTVGLREAGPADGPPVVLLHGLASDGGTWEPALGPLADLGIYAVAPDLLGHGESDKPRTGEYSLDGFATVLTGLLRELELTSVTLAGHSLGGAIAVHFAYHHPSHVQRLALVAAGGLGRQVHVALRAAALPGAHFVVRALVNHRTARIYRDPRLHRALRLSPEDLVNLGRAGRALSVPDARAAFFASLRSVIEPGGQRGSLIEMDYLAEHVPTLIVWSEADHVIPVSHAHALHEHLPTSRLELLPGSSHEPHRRHADRFSAVLDDFVRTTAPAQ